jgi:hypothetical protein
LSPLVRISSFRQAFNAPMTHRRNLVCNRTVDPNRTPTNHQNQYQYQ